MSRNKRVREGLRQITVAFGWPAHAMKAPFGILEDTLRRTPTDDDLDFAVEDKIIFCAFWPEAVPDSPCPLEEDGIEQSRQVLANQLCGLFPFAGGFGFGKTGVGAEHALEYLVDIGHPGFETVVLQRSTDAGPARPTQPVFNSCRDYLNAQQRWAELRTDRLSVQDGLISQADWDQRRSAFVEAFPQLIATVGELISAELPRLRDGVPPLPSHASSLLNTLSAAEWAVSALAGGHEDPPTQALTLISDGYDAGYAPHLILRPLVWIALGDVAKGVADAERLRQEDMGVPLTKRWANRIIERAGKDLLEP